MAEGYGGPRGSYWSPDDEDQDRDVRWPGAAAYSGADDWPPAAPADDSWSPPAQPGAGEPWAARSVTTHSPESPRTRSAPPPEPPPQAPPTAHNRSYAAALGWTIAGALLPGLGLLVAGRRRIGAAVLGGFVLLVGVLAFLGAYDRSDLLHLAVNGSALVWLRASLWVLGLGWVVVIVATHRCLRPRRVSAPARGLGSVLVTLLAVVVLLPVGFGAHLAEVQGDLLDTVFKPQDKIRSETAPKNVTAEDPWPGRDRVNVLLLGGDGGADRQGVRPDSIQVASIDTRTGNTVLIALPRNLEQVPFPAGSKLAAAYPNGVFDPGRRYYSSLEEQEWLLNAIYRNVPAQHPGLLQSDNPGADATKLAVSGALGIQIDYYLLINLDGFKQLIDALGGITVNINEKVAIGGDHQKGTLPSGYLQPGKDVHLDGFNALWFARGRWNSSDYDRMRRQRCTMNAIIQQADPAKVLSRYEAIADASKQIVRTDIPSSLLPAFVDLAMKVKGAKLSSLVFDDSLIRPAHADFDLIHEKTAATIAKSEQSAASGTSTVKPTAPATTPSDQQSPSQSPTGKPTKQASDTESVDQMCAYHPGQDE
ncbi:LCP family protein [Flindersiella endophytica]